MKTQIKVGIIIFSLNGGGAEKAILRLIYNNQTNIEYDLILYKNKVAYTDFLKKIKKNINYYPILNQNSKFFNILIPLNIIFFLIKTIFLVKKNKYNVIMGIEPLMWFPTYFLAKVLALPYVCNLQTPLSCVLKDNKQVIIKHLKFFLKKIAREASAIICVSKGVAYDLSCLMNIKTDKINVVLNGFPNIKENNNKSTIINSLLKIISKNKIIISCGRLIEQKGHSHLINVFKLIKINFKNIKLIILGEGILKNKLIYQIKKLNLEKDVFIINFVEYPEVYFKKSDIFVLPSLYEGLANVVVEAMQSGLPVVSADCKYGPREIICTQNTKYPQENIHTSRLCRYGILTPDFSQNIQKNYQILSETVCSLLNNKKLLIKLKKNGIKRASHFNIKRMQEKYSKIFKKLIN